MAKQNDRSFITLILHVFGFLLLWEWIRPLEEIADTGDVHVFLLFMAIGLLLFYFKIHWGLNIALSVIYIFYTLYVLFPIEGIFKFREWFPFYLEDLKYNSQLVIQADWQGMSNPFRTTLFFVVLWLMVYLIHYWVTTRKRIFLFLFFTLIYITVLDTFTPYDAKIAIVRSVIIGFLALGLLYYVRLLEQEGIKEKGKWLNKWALSLSIMVGFSSLVAYAAPKATPIWPDPVPYLEAYYKRGEDPGGFKRSGYSQDDSSLGGPYIADNSLVFSAEVDEPHYWRIEAKDVYTGKGWVSSLPQQPVNFTAGELVPFSVFPEESKGPIERTARVQFSQNFSQLAYPTGIKTVVDTNPDATFLLDASVEKITPQRNGVPTPLSAIEYSYHLPLYSLSGMKAAQTTGGMSPDVVARYTQLPETLPERVSELALEITKDETNWYDKAVAIRDYLRNGQYVYDELDVAVPGEEDDYVDQFLFESMKGYCDNFSTSMVVMLRTLDIPARWTKGFTEGTVTDYLSNGHVVYEVQNSNAHSWVEVYFPNVGWVPFEPTPGYSNNANIKYDLEIDSPETEAPETPEVEQPEEQTPEEEEGAGASGKNSFSFSEMWDSIKLFFNTYKNWMLAGLVIIGFISWLLYKQRVKWLPRFLILKYKRKKDVASFMNSYISLLDQFRRYGIKFEDGQTLRMYAKYIDFFFSTKDMTKLTKAYESALYGHQKDGDFEDLMKCWENLMKKTLS
ncbi:DUF4129 domain-containing transglutaminase family protein [Bacillus carboniphilus]|uniref:DUF4129 domain-containing transglutaminase family protein n=1 Tax=Bacillus carboniphilus TaxID=86663 RepID=A0ABN0W202_9BACI